MPTKVLKFGGSSLASAETIRKCIDIITKNTDPVYVVVSAPGKRFSGDRKVTDLLEEFVRHKDPELADHALAMACVRFDDIMNGLGIEELDDDLELAIQEFRTLDRTTMTRDYIVTRGEYVMGQILARALRPFYPNVPILSGIIKCDSDGAYDARATKAALEAAGPPAPCSIVPGFYGHLPTGAIKAFKRGGSDISGAIIASAVDASVYENWTDTNGIQTAAPKLVPNAQTVPVIHYRTLRNLAYRGAEVLHPDALLPVSKLGIVTEVRNTFNPDGPFTSVVPDSYTQEDDPSPIIGITGREGFLTLTFEREAMDAEVGYVRKVLTVLERFGIAFEHIASGVDSVSIVIPANAKGLESAAVTIAHECGTTGNYRDKDLSIICVVTSGSLSVAEVTGRALSALAAAKIEVRFIDQGGRNQGIVFGVKQGNYVRALQAVHNAFFPL